MIFRRLRIWTDLHFTIHTWKNGRQGRSIIGKGNMEYRSAYVRSYSAWCEDNEQKRPVCRLALSWGNLFSGKKGDAGAICFAAALSDSRGTISDKYKLESYTCLSGTYVGATLYKSGADTYLTKGRVTSTSKTIRSSNTNVVFKDLWQADYDCANGDSGGAVFDVQCSAIVGIHRGSSGTSTKWENIADEWGLYEY